MQLDHSDPLNLSYFFEKKHTQLKQPQAMQMQLILSLKDESKEIQTKKLH